MKYINKKRLLAFMLKANFNFASENPTVCLRLFLLPTSRFFLQRRIMNKEREKYSVRDWYVVVSTRRKFGFESAKEIESPKTRSYC